MKQSLLKEAYEHLQKKENYILPITTDEKVYKRKIIPAERVILLGGGHVALPTCRFLSQVGFEVTVVDDREDLANTDRFPDAGQVICKDMVEALSDIGIKDTDYVILMTREHLLDYSLLGKILAGQFPYYLGMLGSKKRVGLMFDRLHEDGFDRELLDAINSPIGLDIGALTVEEIALSVAAELVSVRRRKPISREGKIGQIHPEENELRVTSMKEEVLSYAANCRKPFVMMTLCEAKGSTPAKTGSIMFLDSDGRTVGTIGGGPAENAALKEAKKMIGTGKSRNYIVDMNGKTDANGLMLCGGWTMVWLEDVELLNC